MLAVQQLSDQETITEVCIFFFLQLLKHKTTRHLKTDDDSSTSTVQTLQYNCIWSIAQLKVSWTFCQNQYLS